MKSAPAGPSRITRRGLMGLGAGAAAFWGTAHLGACARDRDQPRNVIFLVPDGMSIGVPALAEPFSRLVRGRGTHWHALLGDSGTTLGRLDMASQNSLVTDSAAAASAWGSGRRVLNGMINQYRNGTRLTPLLPLLQDSGRSTGLVTTARVTHATPAGFCADAPHRDREDDLAAAYLARRPGLVLGGGSVHWDPAVRKDGRDLLAEAVAAGYTLLRDRTALQQADPTKPWLGLFAPDHLPYTLDHKGDGNHLVNVPTLAEMTAAALSALSPSRKGFFLMVEGARVDHAAHANDAAGILWEQLAFDDALGVVLDFQKRHPSTLVLVASDHGNANPGLNGMGKGYRESTGCFQRLARATRTAPTMLKALRELAGPSEAEVAALIEGGTGCLLDLREARALLDVLQSKPVAEFSGQQANFYGLLGQMLGNWNGVGWTGVTHTADWTEMLAVGPGQGNFAGLLTNTGFHERLCGIYGITHRNPEDPDPPEVTLPAERAGADPTG